GIVVDPTGPCGGCRLAPRDSSEVPRGSWNRSSAPRGREHAAPVAPRDAVDLGLAEVGAQGFEQAREAGDVAEGGRHRRPVEVRAERDVLAPIRSATWRAWATIVDSGVSRSSLPSARVKPTAN